MARCSSNLRAVPIITTIITSRPESSSFGRVLLKMLRLVCTVSVERFTYNYRRYESNLKLNESLSVTIAFTAPDLGIAERKSGNNLLGTRASGRCKWCATFPFDLKPCVFQQNPPIFWRFAHDATCRLLTKMSRSFTQGRPLWIKKKKVVFFLLKMSAVLRFVSDETCTARWILRRSSLWVWSQMPRDRWIQGGATCKLRDFRLRTTDSIASDPKEQLTDKHLKF